MASPKILVVGSAADGDVKSIVEKINSLNKKNSFSLALIVGDPFGNSEDASETSVNALSSGTLTIDIPTYFGLGFHAFPETILERLSSSEDGSLCENFFFLGKRTTTNTSEGVRIVGLGGNIDTSIDNENSKYPLSPYHSLSESRSLKGAGSTDILITALWPSGIRYGSKIPKSSETRDPYQGTHIAELCAVLKPRYHFSLSTHFFEREPFFHAPSPNEPDHRSITRFISLAPFKNKSKEKWLYAFTLSRDKPTLPPGVTASPFAHISGSKRSADDGFTRFSTDSSSTYRPSKRQRQPPPGPSECFFCLSNPNIATHLIASIGDDVYLTTAKGPLTLSSTFKNFDFPAHILIIPLAHTATLSSIPDPDSRKSTLEEMTRYRDALSSMVSQKSCKTLGSVTWEVSRESGVHVHWQFLPISADLVRKGLVETAFRVESENLKYPSFTKANAAGSTGDFFRVWLWAPSEDKDPSAEKNAPTLRTLVLPLDSSFRFDLQFGRRVMAKLLKLDERMDWKDCAQSIEEETSDVKNFKKGFKEFDFSL